MGFGKSAVGRQVGLSHVRFSLALLLASLGAAGFTTAAWAYDSSNAAPPKTGFVNFVSNFLPMVGPRVNPVGSFSAPGPMTPPPALPRARASAETRRALSMPLLTSARPASNSSQPKLDPRAYPALSARDVDRLLGIDVSSLGGVSTRGAQNYCVRLCDGYAFPVNTASQSGADPENTCTKLCPSAQTQLFSMSGNAKDFDALQRGGLSYSALPNAFRYRRETVAACTCRARGETQKTSALLADPTLRPGDLAMTSTGLKEFRGKPGARHEATAFVAAEAHAKPVQMVQAIRALNRSAYIPTAPRIADIASVAGISNREAPVARIGFRELHVQGEALNPLPKRAVPLSLIR